MTTDHAPTHPPIDVEGIGRRFGYLVAIVVNLVVLYLVRRLDDWDLPFLTDDVTRVQGVMSASIVVAVVVYVAYLVHDPLWFRRVGEMVSLAASFIATVAVLQVFPFDFSRWDGPWELLVRIVLWVAVIGTAIGFLTQFGRLVTGAPARSGPSGPDAPGR